VEIVHLRKYRWRGGGDRGRPCDAELGWLQGNDADKHGNDCYESDEDFFEHRDFLRIGVRFVV
jgi:hypothetical protein